VGELRGRGADVVVVLAGQWVLWNQLFFPVIGMCFFSTDELGITPFLSFLEFWFFGWQGSPLGFLVILGVVFGDGSTVCVCYFISGGISGESVYRNVQTL
jgi:hypothetical protein